MSPLTFKNQANKLQRKLSFNALGVTHEEGGDINGTSVGLSQRNYYNNQHQAHHVTPHNLVSTEGRLQNGQIIDNKNDQTHLASINLSQSQISQMRPTSANQIGPSLDKDNPNFISHTSIIGHMNPKFQSTLLNNITNTNRLHHQSGGSNNSGQDCDPSVYVTKSMPFIDHEDHDGGMLPSHLSRQTSSSKINTSGISATSTPKPDGKDSFTSRIDNNVYPNKESNNLQKSMHTHNFTKRSMWSEGTDASGLDSWAVSSPIGAQINSKQPNMSHLVPGTVSNLNEKLAKLQINDRDVNANTRPHKETESTNNHTTTCSQETKSLEQSSRNSVGVNSANINVTCNKQHSKSEVSSKIIEGNSQTNSLEGTVSGSGVSPSLTGNQIGKSKHGRKSIMKKGAFILNSIKSSGTRRSKSKKEETQ